MQQNSSINYGRELPYVAVLLRNENKEFEEKLSNIGLSKANQEILKNYFKFIDSLIRSDSYGFDMNTLENSKLVNFNATNVFKALSSINNPELDIFKDEIKELISEPISLEKNRIGQYEVFYPDEALKRHDSVGTAIAWSKDSIFMSVCDSVVFLDTDSESGNLEIYQRNNENKVISTGIRRKELPQRLKNISLEDQLNHLGFIEIEAGLYELKKCGEKSTLFLLNKSKTEGAILVDKTEDPLLFSDSAELIGIKKLNHSEYYDGVITYTFKSSKAIFDLDLFGNVAQAHFYEPPDLKDLGIKQATPVTQKNGFTIAGKNESKTISNIGSINGIDITELEFRMKPSGYSSEGFIGKNERLLELLEKDNDFVLANNLTHQELSKPLKYLIAMSKYDNEVEYNNENYKVTRISTYGCQQSPFDYDVGNSIYEVIRTKDGKTFSFADLVPRMIEKYGFYEGKETSYRVEPSDIIEFFNL